MITENLSTLKIHKLTQEQYDRELEAGRIDENAIYLTPDERVEQVQSNWAQNDPTAVDYIRGRTHGAIWSEGELAKGTFAYDITEDFFVGTPTFMANAYMFCLGEKYKITLNGQEFESVLYKNGNQYFCGNLGAMNSLYPNTGEPFIFTFSLEGGMLYLISLGELGVPLDAPFEFSVYGKFVPSSFEELDIAPEDLIMTLQEEYLPSNIRELPEAIETLRESLDNLASKTYVDNSIASLVNSAPETLDTLGELAAAMEENDGVVNALNQAIANKADNSTVTQLQETVNAKAENSALNEHTSNTTIHITAVERAAWNSKMDSDSELISIADIDAICGSVAPIAEVLF